MPSFSLSSPLLEDAPAPSPARSAGPLRCGRWPPCSAGPRRAAVSSGWTLRAGCAGADTWTAATTAATGGAGAGTGATSTAVTTGAGTAAFARASAGGAATRHGARVHAARHEESSGREASRRREQEGLPFPGERQRRVRRRRVDQLDGVRLHRERRRRIVAGGDRGRSARRDLRGGRRLRRRLLGRIEVSAAPPRRVPASRSRGRAGRVLAPGLRLDDHGTGRFPVRRRRHALTLGVEQLVEEEREVRREERERDSP